MKIAVVGASGRSGIESVRVAAEAGHDPVAVVRDPAKPVGPAAAVRVADVLDPEALAVAFAGTDAVVSCLGPVPGESPTILRDGTVALLDGMVRAGVGRLVVVSASGWVVDGDDPLSRYVAKPILARLLAEANRDLAAMEALVRASSADWTIVRPPRLQGSGRGHYRARRDGNVRWRYTMARADLALALVDLVDDPSAIGATVSVAG